MTGLIARLAARGGTGGSGQQSGDAAAMTAPIQPRFAGIGADEAPAQVAEPGPEQQGWIGADKEPVATPQQGAREEPIVPAPPVSHSPSLIEPTRETSAPGASAASDAPGPEPSTSPVTEPDSVTGPQTVTAHKEPGGILASQSSIGPSVPVHEQESASDPKEITSEMVIESRTVVRQDDVPETSPPPGDVQPESAAPLPPERVAPVGQRSLSAPVQPATTLSIGRIDVVIEQPPAPTPLPARPTRPEPNRTRGFDAYGSRRLGRRR